MERHIAYAGVWMSGPSQMKHACGQLDRVIHPHSECWLAGHSEFQYSTKTSLVLAHEKSVVLLIRQQSLAVYLDKGYPVRTLEIRIGLICLIRLRPRELPARQTSQRDP